MARTRRYASTARPFVLLCPLEPLLATALPKLLDALPPNPLPLLALNPLPLPPKPAPLGLTSLPDWSWKLDPSPGAGLRRAAIGTRSQRQTCDPLRT